MEKIQGAYSASFTNLFQYASHSADKFISEYSLPGNDIDGTGVDVVSVDTGIDASHYEFTDANGNSRIQFVNWDYLVEHGDRLIGSGSAGWDEWRSQDTSLQLISDQVNIIYADWYAESGSYNGFLYDSETKKSIAFDTLPVYMQHYIPYMYTSAHFHGTHTAATMAGRTVGWASNSEIYVLSAYTVPNRYSKASDEECVHMFHTLKKAANIIRPTIVNESMGVKPTNNVYESELKKVLSGSVMQTGIYTGSMFALEYRNDPDDIATLRSYIESTPLIVTPLGGPSASIAVSHSLWGLWTGSFDPTSPSLLEYQDFMETLTNKYKLSPGIRNTNYDTGALLSYAYSKTTHNNLTSRFQFRSTFLDNGGIWCYSAMNNGIICDHIDSIASRSEAVYVPHTTMYNDILYNPGYYSQTRSLATVYTDGVNIQYVDTTYQTHTNTAAFSTFNNSILHPDGIHPNKSSSILSIYSTHDYDELLTDGIDLGPIGRYSGSILPPEDIGMSSIQSLSSFIDYTLDITTITPIYANIDYNTDLGNSKTLVDYMVNGSSVYPFIYTSGSDTIGDIQSLLTNNNILTEFGSSAEIKSGSEFDISFTAIPGDFANPYQLISNAEYRMTERQLSADHLLYSGHMQSFVSLMPPEYTLVGHYIKYSEEPISQGTFVAPRNSAILDPLEPDNGLVNSFNKTQFDNNIFIFSQSIDSVSTYRIHAGNIESSISSDIGISHTTHGLNALSFTPKYLLGTRNLNFTYFYLSSSDNTPNVISSHLSNPTVDGQVYNNVLDGDYITELPTFKESVSVIPPTSPSYFYASVVFDPLQSGSIFETEPIPFMRYGDHGSPTHYDSRAIVVGNTTITHDRDPHAYYTWETSSINQSPDIDQPMSDWGFYIKKLHQNATSTGELVVNFATSSIMNENISDVNDARQEAYYGLHEPFLSNLPPAVSIEHSQSLLPKGSALSHDVMAYSSDKGPRIDINAPGTMVYSAVPFADTQLNIMKGLPYMYSSSREALSTKITPTQETSSELYSLSNPRPGLYTYHDVPSNEYHRYRFLNGTSMSSPQVAGVLALYAQINKNIDSDSARKWLHANAYNGYITDPSVPNADTLYNNKFFKQALAVPGINHDARTLAQASKMDLSGQLDDDHVAKGQLVTNFLGYRALMGRQYTRANNRGLHGAPNKLLHWPYSNKNVADIEFASNIVTNITFTGSVGITNLQREQSQGLLFERAITESEFKVIDPIDDIDVFSEIASVSGSITSISNSRA